ncbi:MAG: acyltransferase [Ramlibacter sp.]|nr:acyltransferase [Ramlibacter sp.]
MSVSGTALADAGSALPVPPWSTHTMLRPLLLWPAFAALLAFLLIEPMRTEIAAFAGPSSLAGWMLFTFLRLLALAAAVIALYQALPGTSAAVVRAVPRPAAGADPLLTLRAFACFLVVAGHSTGIHFVPTGMPANLEQGGFAWLMAGAPWAGVWVFFVLSGYLMGKGFYSGRYGLNRTDVAAFYRNRLLRIAPLYGLVLLVVVLLTRPEMLTQHYGFELLALLLFTPPAQSPLPVVEALWSVQTEIAFYALVPLLFAGIELLPERLRRPGHLAALMIAVLVAGLAYRWSMIRTYGLAGWNVKTYLPLLGNLDMFLLGMVLNWLVPSAVRAARGRSLLGMALALLALFYGAVAWHFAQAAFGVQRGAYFVGWITVGPMLTGFAAAAVILLMEAHVGGGRTGRALTRALLRGTQWAGILTYAIYVWHEPVFKWFAVSFRGGAGMGPALAGAAVALVVTLVLAGLSYRAVERPFERRKRKSFVRRTNAASEDAARPCPHTTGL